MKITKKMRKSVYDRLLSRTIDGIVNAELRAKVVKRIREAIRLEFDKMGDAIKGIEEEEQKIREKIAKKPDEEQLKQLNKELQELYDTKHNFELDADKMKEQMMGKWIESEEKYSGGLDEEIKNIESNIAGGNEFGKVVEEELKKL